MAAHIHHQPDTLRVLIRDTQIWFTPPEILEQLESFYQQRLADSHSWFEGHCPELAREFFGPHCLVLSAALIALSEKGQVICKERLVAEGEPPVMEYSITDRGRARLNPPAKKKARAGQRNWGIAPTPVTAKVEPE